MNNLIKGSMFVVLLGGGFVTSQAVGATQTSPTGDSMFYYKLGGGRVFRAVPRWETTTINLSASASGTGMSCGKFDPKITLSNSLNDVRQGVDDLYNQLESAASAAISNLPGYILSKVNPNLYDIFMNAIAQAQAKFKLATKSCEMIESQIRNGQDPFEEFATVSYGDTWEAGIGTAGADATDVHEAAKEATDNGVVHPCLGRVGGKNQLNYAVVGDTAAIGYNRLVDRDKCAVGNPAIGASASPLVEKFSNPQKVREWLNIVVGEVNVDIDKDGGPTSMAGMGLLPLISAKKEDVFNKLVDMYEGSTPVNLNNLDKVSAPGIVITPQIISSLRYLESREAEIYIDRISDEVAVSDVIDSALLIRRTLATGVKETDSYRNRGVVKIASESIQEIDDGIGLVMKENEIRKKLLGKTIPLLLDMTRAKEHNSLRESPVRHNDDHLLNEGRFKN